MKAIYRSLLLVLGLTSCTNDFEKINTSPISPSKVPAEYLFSQALLTGTLADGQNWLQVGSWVEHWASGSLAAPSQYQEDRDIYETTNWANHYSLIKNLAQIRNQVLKGQENTADGRTKLAIARIFEIFLWQRMTDFWGDIPYTQAGLSEQDLILTPKYDKQEDIYPALITELNTAMSRLNSQDISYASADYIYKGSTTAWMKFGNALKLRLGMRLRYANPELARKTVEEALKGPVFESNTDNAAMPTVPRTGYTFGYHPVIGGYNSSKELNQLAEPLVTKLLALNDPRLPIIAEPTENSKKAGAPVYRGLGVALGSGVTINRNDYSYPSIATFDVLNDTFPYLFLTYSDVCFYKAEAALLGWGGLTAAQAQTFYQAGIRAVMETKPYSLSSAVITDYLAKQGTLSGTDEQQLEQIMTQKWISLFMRSYEAYAEWRRTGYPKLTPGPNKGTTNGQIPRRAVYSGNERLRNATEYQTAASRLANGDTYLSKVWWDKKP